MNFETKLIFKGPSEKLFTNSYVKKFYNIIN